MRNVPSLPQFYTDVADYVYREKQPCFGTMLEAAQNTIMDMGTNRIIPAFNIIIGKYLDVLYIYF